MSFLNPLFLWALPAAGIPILLHLLNRRPPKKISFSYLGWLRQVHKTTMPKKKLREFLLLVARTLIVLFLVFFFARPLLQRGGLFSGSTANESMVILLDVSPSMGAVDGGRCALDWAKEHLQSVLRKIPYGTKIGLVIYSDRVELELSPTDERSKLTNALQNAKVTNRSTNVLSALKLGYAMLAHQPKGRKTLLVASDQAENGWRSTQQLQTRWDSYDPEVRVVLWEVMAPVSNAGFSDATLQLSEEGTLKGQAALHRSQLDVRKPAWKLRLNNRVVSQGNISWSAGTADLLALQAQLPEGGYYAGQLDLTTDAASFDDTYYLAGRVPKGFRLLIIDGESGLAPVDSETYYLKSALESPRDPRLESIHVFRPDFLEQISFDSYDAVILANVSGLGSGEAALINWVERGGGLFLTAGSRWPKPPQVPLRLFRSKTHQAGLQKLKTPDPAASLLSGVSGLSKFQWNQIDVTDYVALEPESAATPLISLENGDPILVRKQIGKGFVLCLTTTIDRAWTNFPAKPVFAPLVRELIAALADPLREQTTLHGFVGEPVRLRVPSGVHQATIVAPDGIASGARIDKEGVMDIPAPSVPGLYHVQTDRKEADFFFAINIPNLDQEGNVTRLDEKKANEIFPHAPVELLTGKKNKVESLTSALQGRDLTGPLLICVLFFFVLETILGWRGKTVAAFSFLLLFSPHLKAGSGNDFVYVQLKHGGAWDPYPGVHERIFQMMKSMTNIRFLPERKTPALGSPTLFDHPFLLIKGNSELTLSLNEKNQLKEFIDRGGFVFIDDTFCDPHGPFAESVRRLMAELYPDRSFQKLPTDHALFRSFFLLRQVSGRRMAGKYLEGLDIASGLGGEGRTAVIYCPNDLLGAWMKDNLGHYTFTCEPGGETQRWEAFKLTINVIYFSLTGTYKKDAIHQPFIEMKLGS